MFVVILLAWVDAATAATYYVRPGASGNGSNWAGAYGSLPAALERGSTYYLAAGNYPSRSFDDPESGDAVITLKKATLFDHGSGDGWQDGYAGQAVFSADWVFHKGRYVIDGQARNDADWQQADAYGIRIAIGAATRQNDLIGGIMIPDRVTGVTIRHVAMTGAACAYGKVAGRGINIASAGAFDITVKQCLIANTAVPILTRGVNGMRVEACWIGPNYPIYDGYHCEGWSDTNSQDVTICNNRFVDIMNTAFITVLTSVGPLVHRNWKIHGNVFMHSPISGWNGWGVGNGIVAVINDNTAVGWRVYNNTIVGTKGWFASIDIPGADNAVYNNIWYHLGRNPQGGPTGIGINATAKGYNWICLDNGAAINPSALGGGDVIGTGDPFINWRVGDVRLNPSASGPLPINAGRMLESAYDNLDPAGAIRGADGGWDIGAFENSGAVDQTQPNAPTNLRKLSATQSRIEFAWDPPAGSPVLVRGYRVLKDGLEIGTTSELRHAATGLNPLTPYHFDVRAESYAGILSDPAGGIDISTLEPDTLAPTVPGDLQGQALSTSDVALSWNESTDDQRVAGYDVYCDGDRLLTTEMTSYAHSELSPSTQYVYQVAAFDDAGNQSVPAKVSVRTLDLPPIESGLVARYEFDEGSGTIAQDLSPLGNTAYIIFNGGPVWRPGKRGMCLAFNTTSGEYNEVDFVEVPRRDSLELGGGMTLMAWVNPSAPLLGWQRVIAKEHDALTLGYFLAANAGHTDSPWAGINIENNWVSDGGGDTLPAGTWSHLASTYDGHKLKVFVNAMQVASLDVGLPIQPTAGPLHIGGNDLNEYFTGLVDQVMIFNRALAPAEIRYIYQWMGGPINSVQSWLFYR
ncbi:MAG: LamG-like jellyroll fold domain-containing protein [Candidatus Sumerlaeia bacterium]